MLCCTVGLLLERGGEVWRRSCSGFPLHAGHDDRGGAQRDDQPARGAREVRDGPPLLCIQVDSHQRGYLLVRCVKQTKTIVYTRVAAIICIFKLFLRGYDDCAVGNLQPFVSFKVFNNNRHFSYK